MTQPADNSGAPRSAYASRDDFIIICREAVEALGSWKEAGVFQHIAWRSERDGSWIATVAQIAEECYLTVGTARRVLDSLRAKGWIASERVSAEKATLRWSVVWSSDEVRKVSTTEVRKMSGPGAQNEHLPEVRRMSTTHSSKTNETTTDREVAAFAPPVDLFGAPIEEEHPKPGDVVASWHAGQRDAGEERAHPAVAKRVAGRVKDLARECVTPEDWRRLMEAGYQAGLHGRWDISEFLVSGQPRRSAYQQTGGIGALMRAGGWGLAAPHGGDVASQAAHNGRPRLTR